MIIHKPFLGPREVPQKMWARSVQPFWRLLDTNEQTGKQTPRQAKYKNTKLLRALSSIFYFNSGHFLLVYIVKHKPKKVADFIKKKFTGFLKFWLPINLPWGHVKSHTQFGPDRFSRFDVYWIQTDRHAKYVLS